MGRLSKGFADFQAYRSEGGVSELNEFLVEAQLSGIPMSADQVDRLLGQRTTHQFRVKTASSSVRAYDWDAIISDRGDALSHEQRELLRRFGELKSASIARTVASSALRKRAANTNPPPAP